MPELGNRGNVMGPQPIATPVVPPAEVETTAKRIAGLLAGRKGAELEQMTVEAARTEMAALVEAVPAAMAGDREIIGTARVNHHYYVKVRMSAERAEPFIFQVRLGERDGRWMVWEALNLSGGRTAWTR